MQYIIKDANNEEHGSVDAETLAKWLEEDRITAETPVRNSLVVSWRTVGDLPFLAERLAEQAVRIQKSATMTEKSGSILKNIKKRLVTKFVPRHSSRFEHKRAPQYAQMMPRFMAGLYDLMLILLIGMLICAAGIFHAYSSSASMTDDSKQEIAEKDNMMLAVKRAERKRRLEMERSFAAASKGKKGEELEKFEKSFAEKLDAEKKKNAAIRKKLHENNLNADCPPCTLADKDAAYQVGSIWVDTTTNQKYVCLSGKVGAARWINTKDLTGIMTVCVTVWAIVILLFYAFCLGYYSQTFGMWYWGIFISKRKTAEVYFFRAFIFTLLYPVCFILSPLFVYIFHRGLHEILCGVKLIRVFGNRKAR